MSISRLGIIGPLPNSSQEINATAGIITQAYLTTPLVATKGKITLAYLTVPLVSTKGIITQTFLRAPNSSIIDDALNAMSGMRILGDIEDF